MHQKFTKNLNVTLLVLILSLISTSCIKGFETNLEPDYKVVQIDYGFNNYMNSRDSEGEPFIIKERNIVITEVDQNGITSIEDKIVADSLISYELIKYITPRPSNDKMPMTIEREFEYSGNVTMTKSLLVAARYHDSIDYKKYSYVRNNIYAAYNTVRNDFCLEKFDKTIQEILESNEEVDNEIWREVRQIFPIRYHEIL